MPQTAKYDIFLDGTCSFCRWSQAKIEPYDSGERVRFLDYNDPAVAALVPFPRGDLDREMHMGTPEGNWLRGFEAWLALLQPKAEHRHTLLTMEFKRFLQVWLLLPCQVVRSGRQFVFRLLQYNDWVPVLLRTVDLLHGLRLT